MANLFRATNELKLDRIIGFSVLTFEVLEAGD